MGFSQTPIQDSLYDLLLDKQDDSTRAKILNKIAVSFQDVNDYVAIKEAKRALEFARKSKHKYQESLALYHVGASYANLTRFEEALSFYFQSLRIAEEIKSDKMILQNYNQIGIIYSYQKNSKQAYKYFSKFLGVALKSGDKGNIARGYNNIGISLKNEGKLDEAITNYKKALKIFEEVKFNRGIISCLSNIGVGKMEINELDSAAFYYNKASDLAISERDTFSMAIAYINIGELNLKKKKYSKALNFYDKAMFLSNRFKMIQQLRDANEGLYRCYEQMGNYEKAFVYHRNYLDLRDSISKDETNGKLNLAEQNYEELKKEKIRELEEQKAELQKAESKRLLAEERANNEESKKYIWVLILVSISIAITVIILFLRYKEKNRSNSILQQQRDEIAHSKKEITDSINYALRIQQAVLPDEKLLGKHFSEYFILYKPKDIVSGDFYWFAEVNENFIIAAADCTGHGVPGGFMSMIGTDKLNHAVFEKGEVNPGKILSIVSQGVKTALKQDDSENSSRDGMDVSLCNFKFGVDTKLNYSGANRPLWLVKGDSFTEIKPTKAAIGGFTTDSIVFETTQIQIEKETSLYMFSDGFVDQFGGAEEKKLSSKRFKEQLLAIQNLPMKDQKKNLESFFEKWKGNTDQIDDVLVIGIRV